MVTESGVAAPHASSHEPGGSDVVSSRYSNDETVVYTGNTGGGAWRTVDCSAVTGAAVCSVVFELFNAGAGTYSYGIRTPGTVGATYSLLDDTARVMSAKTDVNGHVEASNASVRSHTIRIISW